MPDKFGIKKGELKDPGLMMTNGDLCLVTVYDFCRGGKPATSVISSLGRLRWSADHPFMSTILSNQVHAFHDSVMQGQDEGDDSAEHGDAGDVVALDRTDRRHEGRLDEQRRDAEVLVGVGLSLLDVTNQSSSRPVPNLTPAQAAALDRELEGLYRMLDEALDKTAAIVNELESKGIVVEGADRFHDARAGLKAMLAIDPRRVERAMQQVRQGKTKSMAEVRDGLRRRMVAGG